MLREDIHEEVQLTRGRSGHLIHNTQVFSQDDQWIVFDGRNDETRLGANPLIAKVNVATREIVTLYQTRNQTEHGPGVGAATFSPIHDRVMFIHGLANCDASRPYSMTRRTGAVVDREGRIAFLDARDVSPPFTPGALRGGTHAHTWSGDGKWISFTYQDAVLAELEAKEGARLDLRTVGVSAPSGPVKVTRDASGENHDGEMFSVLIAKVAPEPRWGSDEIERALEDGWAGKDGYMKTDGTRQRRAIAFQGHVRDEKGGLHAEVFIADLPEDITQPGADGPLQGTPTQRPMPPAGVVQRRLTRTLKRKHPGIQGPRHWLRSSPDGSRIAFLAKDDGGVVQLFSISPLGGQPVQLTRNPFSVQTPFNWSPDGKRIAYGMDNSVWVTEVETGDSTRLTRRSADAQRPVQGVVWPNDGTMLAYNRYVPDGNGAYLQVFLVRLGKR